MTQDFDKLVNDLPKQLAEFESLRSQALKRATQPLHGFLLAAELNLAVEWFERMGVDVRKSRLGRYVDRISLLAVLKQEKSLITYCHHWLLWPLAEIPALDRKIVEAIGGAIGNANSGVQARSAARFMPAWGSSRADHGS